MSNHQKMRGHSYNKRQGQNGSLEPDPQSMEMVNRPLCSKGKNRWATNKDIV